MLPFENFAQLSLFIVNFYLKSCTFFLHFILYLHVWIWIRISNTDPDPESSEYRSNTVWDPDLDPDPQHCSKNPV